MSERLNNRLLEFAGVIPAKPQLTKEADVQMELPMEIPSNIKHEIARATHDNQGVLRISVVASLLTLMKKNKSKPQDVLEVAKTLKGMFDKWHGQKSIVEKAMDTIFLSYSSSWGPVKDQVKKDYGIDIDSL